MKKQWSRAALGVVLAIAVLLSTVGVAAFAVQTRLAGGNAQAALTDYEIYPVPHSITTRNGGRSIRKKSWKRSVTWCRPALIPSANLSGRSIRL